VLGLALVGLTASWLEGRDWFTEHPWGSLGRLADPWSCRRRPRAGMLSLAWMATRLGLRSQATAQRLLEPDWPTVDRVTLGALVIGQLVLSVLYLLPALVRELDRWRRRRSRTASAFTPSTAAPGACSACWPACWCSACGSAARGGLHSRPGRRRRDDPVLIAGPFEAWNAAGLALRWGLAFAFVAASVPVVLRDRLHELAIRAKCNIEENASLPSLARATLVGGMAVPILSMTLGLALAVIAGQRSLGRMKAPSSSRSPDGGQHRAAWARRLRARRLRMRERSAGYAFKAGLVVNFAVSSATRSATSRSAAA